MNTCTRACWVNLCEHVFSRRIVPTDATRARRTQRKEERAPSYRRTLPSHAGGYSAKAAARTKGVDSAEQRRVRAAVHASVLVAIEVVRLELAQRKRAELRRARVRGRGLREGWRKGAGRAP
eukprot:6183767-Pleurochrysis_carterae.AAC.6